MGAEYIQDYFNPYEGSTDDDNAMVIVNEDEGNGHQSNDDFDMLEINYEDHIVVNDDYVANDNDEAYMNDVVYEEIEYLDEALDNDEPMLEENQCNENNVNKHESKKNVCETCGKTYAVSYFKQHLLQHKNEMAGIFYFCDVIGYKARFLVEHRLKILKIQCQKIRGLGSLYCEGCKKYMNDRKSYSLHMRAHKCRDMQCKRVFDTVAEKKSHERMHVKPNCDMCVYYEFQSTDDYFAHIKRCNPLFKGRIENMFVSLTNDVFDLFASNAPKVQNVSW